MAASKHERWRTALAVLFAAMIMPMYFVCWWINAVPILSEHPGMEQWPSKPIPYYSELVVEHFDIVLMAAIAACVLAALYSHRMSEAARVYWWYNMGWCLWGIAGLSALLFTALTHVSWYWSFLLAHPLEFITVIAFTSVVTAILPALVGLVLFVMWMMIGAALKQV